MTSASVGVVLPAKQVASTIGPILEVVTHLRHGGVVGDILVVDAASTDGTADIAAGLGARVMQRNEIMAEHGSALGKGDALWRGLHEVKGDIVVFLDADTQNFGEHFVTDLIRPLVQSPAISFVKATFERPLRLGGLNLENEGGRVTALVAKPLIRLLFPELARFDQPLAGEIAARRELLEALPFPVGYGVEIGLLIDALAAVGPEGLTQADLGRREDASKPLADLSSMATSVLVTALRRAGVSPADAADAALRSLIERPPLASLSRSP